MYQQVKLHELFFENIYIAFVPVGMKVCIGARFGYNIFHSDATQYVMT
jgi:hypothetical protein